MATRRLAAILAADVVGFSALVNEDEEGTISRLINLRRYVIEPKIKEHNGRTFKTMGDGFLCEFVIPVEAVRCAVAIQELLACTAGQEPPAALQFRIGINIGDVIVEEDGDVYGDVVNIASRLQKLSEPGKICISSGLYDAVKDQLEHEICYFGSYALKNIRRPISVYLLDPKTVASDNQPREVLRFADRPAVAVMPFLNMSGDPEHEIFADGLADDIINALSRARWLLVISRNSTFTYKHSNLDMKRVARELGVRYIVSGSVRAYGGRIRVSAQLVEAETGKNEWAEHYDRQISDIFEIQDDITARIAAAIEPHLYAAESAHYQARPTTDLDAWGKVVRALSHVWRHSVSEIEAARRLLEQAIEHDPSYAKAHALLGWSTCKLFPLVTVSQMSEVLSLAYASAQRAVQLDEQEPWAHLVFGVVHARRRETHEAISALRRAVELNPSFPLGHAYLGYAIAAGGDSDGGLKMLDRAIRISPRDPFLATEAAPLLTVAYFAAGDYDQVVRFCKEQLRERPSAVGAFRFLAASLGKGGRLEEGRNAVRELLKLDPLYSVAAARRTCVLSGNSLEEFIAGLRVSGLPD